MNAGLSEFPTVRTLPWTMGGWRLSSSVRLTGLRRSVTHCASRRALLTVSEGEAQRERF